MGSGKSSVGRELASLTGLLFIDLDEYIEHKTGQSIPGIIADGEDRFRAIEAEAFRDIFIMREIRNESAVVALGGGTVETDGRTTEEIAAEIREKLENFR